MRKISFDQVKSYIELFDYKLLSDSSLYENRNSKLLIECEHGHQYYVAYIDFRAGSRCLKCHFNNRKNNYEDVKNYIESFGYTLISKEYINCETKLEMICPEGHQHSSRYDNFKSGFRCNVCGIKQRTEQLKYSYQEVKDYIESFKGYELLSDNYIDCKNKLKIKCNQGHIFETTFDRFKNYGFYCPICSESDGEQRIRYYLKSHNYNFKGQYKIEDCKNVRSLPFDFAVFDDNNQLQFIIEFDGVQHIKPKFGDEIFKRTIEHDKIKNLYCKQNNISILRIPYVKLKYIESILDSYFATFKNNQIQQETQQSSEKVS
jgi:hypothetical protein